MRWPGHRSKIMTSGSAQRFMTHNNQRPLGGRSHGERPRNPPNKEERPCETRRPRRAWPMLDENTLSQGAELASATRASCPTRTADNSGDDRAPERCSGSCITEPPEAGRMRQPGQAKPREHHQGVAHVPGQTLRSLPRKRGCVSAPQGTKAITTGNVIEGRSCRSARVCRSAS